MIASSGSSLYLGTGYYYLVLFLPVWLSEYHVHILVLDEYCTTTSNWRIDNCTKTLLTSGDGDRNDYDNSYSILEYTTRTTKILAGEEPESST